MLIIQAINILQKATDIEDSFSDGNEEQSYEISPYKCSDDEEEDEDEDDTPNDKFVPSWARSVYSLCCANCKLF